MDAHEVSDGGTNELDLADRSLRTGRIGLHKLFAFLKRSWAPVVFALIALLPVLRRIQHPTLLCDDVTRVVDLIEHPLSELLFRPFSEHVAPLFEAVSWMTWQMIGHDLRLAPLGFCIASVLPWVLLLAVMGVWLIRETGSRTATLVAIALAAQSPLALEAMWWYSASSFTYAVLGVMVAVLGASWLALRPRRGLVLIGVGAALAPACTTIGVLAAPLAGLRALLEPMASWQRKAQAVLAALGGLMTYLLAGQFAGMGLFRSVRTNNLGMAEPVTGLGYALTVPGRVLWPTVVGVPPSWTIRSVPTELAWLLGILALLSMLTLVLMPKARWNRRLVLLGGAMIYVSYALAYCSRAGMVRLGKWTEPQLLYEFGGRYHLLPLLGLCSVIAALIAALPMVRRCDAFVGRPAVIGIIVAMLTLVVNRHEVDRWNYVLRQPDQKATLAAVHHVGELARAEGISRGQLTRVFDPVLRLWNEGVRLNPPYFHFMKMAVQAPLTVVKPLSDDEARNRLLSQLTHRELSVLGAGACVSMSEEGPGPAAKTLAVARRVKIENARELEPGRYQQVGWPAYIEYEFDLPNEARFLTLPELKSQQDLKISWSDEQGRWRPLQHVCWLTLPPPRPSAAIDLSRLVNWPTGREGRIRVQFTLPGELVLKQPPHLLR